MNRCALAMPHCPGEKPSRAFFCLIDRRQRRGFPGSMAIASCSGRRVPQSAILLALVLVAASGPARSAEPEGFAKFLAEREIDRPRRAVLEEAGPWDDARQKAAIRVLARLDAPAALEVPWRLRATGPAMPPVVEDRMVRIAGRAAFVAPVPLTDEQAVLAARPRLDLVRIVAAEGTIVDVVVPEAPAAWPRWQPIDEPAFVVGLPLSTVAALRPAGPADAASWPAAAPALLLAAPAVGWNPPTPLGGLGMDYGLFASVMDGKRLERGDTAAFYAMLAAVGRAAPGAIEAAAGKPADIVAIIDPTRKWFAAHRGAPVTVTGIARRVTKISIDEAWRREEVGADHYWELYVFVDTPLLQVNERKQTDYPFVCCVRTLPEGFPTGDDVGEKVTVSGFALKRYAYPLPDLDIRSSQGDKEIRGQRMETALLIGRTVGWKPEPLAAAATSTLSWIFSTLAALIGLALVYGLWSMNRGGRRRDLPDRIELPGGRD